MRAMSTLTTTAATKATLSVLALLAPFLAAAPPAGAAAPAQTGTSYESFCPRMHRPVSHVKTFFNTPEQDTISPITKALVGLACAAAKGTTIRISLYYLDYLGEDSELARLLTVLDYVHRTRNVTIDAVLEGTLIDSDPAFTAAKDRLKEFANVAICPRGCLSERTGTDVQGDIQHSKVFMVGNTIWRTGYDPVVVSSSANWSWSQLRDRQQSAVMVWDDSKLYQEYATRWAIMDTCASWKLGCAAWNGQLASRGLDPNHYGIVRREDGLWSEVNPQIRYGSPGRGLSVQFSPWVSGDPVAQALRDTNCTRGGEVRLGHLVVAAGRTAVIDALSTLRQNGCSVQVLVSAAPFQQAISGEQAMRSAGLDVSCVPGLHDKFITFDSRVGDPNSRRVVWSGSQNLYSGSLRVDDEELLRLSVRDATGQAAIDNAAAYASYRNHWAHLAALRVSCPTTATQTAPMREPS